MAHSDGVDVTLDSLISEFDRPLREMNYDVVDSLLDQLHVAIQEDIDWLNSIQQNTGIDVVSAQQDVDWLGSLRSGGDTDQLIDSDDEDDDSVVTAPLSFNGGRPYGWNSGFDSDGGSTDSEIEDWDDPYDTPPRYWY